MKRQTFFLLLVLVYSIEANVIAAEALPSRIQVGDSTLSLNGKGSRTKYLMEMYVGGLYLSESSSNAAAILAAEEPMAIRLQITSGLVSQEKLVASINEGFQNSTGGHTAAIEAQINAFRRCFADAITKGDVFEIAYLPSHGIVVVKNGQPKGVIPGLAFKQAVFGIWLSDNPADADLRVAMLQGRK